MKKRTVVIRRNSCYWQLNTKRKNKICPLQVAGEVNQTVKNKLNAGFISPVFVVIGLAAFSGLFYLYCINQTATKGIEIMRAEKEISAKKNENESLKIKEAELKSLYNIEQLSSQLDMVNSSKVNYIEENPSVAYVAAEKNEKK